MKLTLICGPLWPQCRAVASRGRCLVTHVCLTRGLYGETLSGIGNPVDLGEKNMTALPN